MAVSSQTHLSSRAKIMLLQSQSIAPRIRHIQSTPTVLDFIRGHPFRTGPSSSPPPDPRQIQSCVHQWCFWCVLKQFLVEVDNCSLVLLQRCLRKRAEACRTRWDVEMTATKLLSNTKNLSYKERLIMLNLPTLKYWRLRGDMIEMYKIITNKQDSDVTLKFNIIPAANTIGNIYKIRQDHVRHDLRKFSFSNRVRTLWNSLPDIRVGAQSTLGARHFCPKIYAWKINKMPEFYIIFARKINKIPEFYMIYARKINKMPDFTWFCPKNIFPNLGASAPCPRLLRLCYQIQ